MESVGADEVKKRRLPAWMMGAVGSIVVREENKDGGVGSQVGVAKVKTRSRITVKKMLREDEVSPPKLKARSRKVVNASLDEVEEGHELVEVDAPKSKRRSRKGNMHEGEEANTDSSCVLVKCDTIQRKRKNSSEVEYSDAGGFGNEKLDQIAAPKKKGNVDKLKPKELSLSSCTNSGKELLMEDLISIAEEYVKVESLTEQHQQTVEANQQEEKLSATDPSFDESVLSFDNGQTKCVSTITEVKPNFPSSIEKVQTNTSTFSDTGDAAQDMLNLLLGPLLTKPAEESTTTLTRDDMLFDRPAQTHSRNQIVEELAPPAKKKTSLKDKVAMFFD